MVIYKSVRILSSMFLRHYNDVQRAKFCVECTHLSSSTKEPQGIEGYALTSTNDCQRALSLQTTWSLNMHKIRRNSQFFIKLGLPSFKNDRERPEIEWRLHGKNGSKFVFIFLLLVPKRRPLEHCTSDLFPKADTLSTGSDKWLQKKKLTFITLHLKTEMTVRLFSVKQ